MAIVFDKQLSTTELLPAYNNQVIKFHSTSLLKALSCSLQFPDFSIEITPNPSGIFSYNFKRAASVHINKNRFKDEIIPELDRDDVQSFIVPDPSLYLNLSVTLKITFEGGTTESLSKSYQFIRAVRQPALYRETLIDTATDSLTLLLPSRGRSKKTFYATYFEGCPFDFTLFSNIARNIQIINKTTNSSISVDVVFGTSRIFISQGNEDITTLDTLIIATGYNEIEIQVTSQNFVTLILERVESECAPYVRYHNLSGSYSYWRFNGIHKEVDKTKTTDTIRTDSESIEETFEIAAITGKESVGLLNVISDRITVDQEKNIRELLGSPRVELMVTEVFDKHEAKTWLGVQLSDGSFQVKNTKKPLGELKLSIGYDKYAMTL